MEIKLNKIKSFVDLDTIINGTVLFVPFIEKNDQGEFSCGFNELVVCKDEAKLEKLPAEMKDKMKKENQVLVYPKGSDDDNTAFLVTLKKGVCDESHKKECLELFRKEFQDMADTVSIAIKNLEEDD